MARPHLAGETPPLICIIDDDLALRRLLQQTFVDAGYAVLTSARMADALALLTAIQPALVILDPGPVAECWPRVEQLLHDAALAHTALILCTDQPAVYRAAIAMLPPERCIVVAKPGAPDELLALGVGRLGLPEKRMAPMD
jgi:DNA-binding response OmpR family regulator